MPSFVRISVALAAAALGAHAQTFQRLGTCPTLGCVFPPDQADFLPGQVFDIRLEVHAPINGSEAFNNGVTDDKFSFTIHRVGEHGAAKSAKDFFGRKAEPALEKWSFSYFEDLFAQDAKVRLLGHVLGRADLL